MVTSAVEWSLLLYNGHFCCTAVTSAVQWSLPLYSGHFCCTVVTSAIKRACCFGALNSETRGRQSLTRPRMACMRELFPLPTLPHTPNSLPCKQRSNALLRSAGNASLNTHMNLHPHTHTHYSVQLSTILNADLCPLLNSPVNCHPSDTCTNSFSRIRTHVCTHTHSLSLSLTHTHTHTLSLSHTHTFSLSLTHTHTFSLSLSHTHMHAHMHTHTYTHTHTRTCMYTHTHTRI